jgi:GTP-binding protein
VLSKAIELDLKPIVVINKVDKPNCRPDEVHEAVFDLMYHLNATEDQLGFETLYGSSKQGWMSRDWRNPTSDITELLDMIIDQIPEAPFHDGTVQMQVASLDYSNYVGRIAIGRVFRGTLAEGRDYMLCTQSGPVKVRVKELFVFQGMGRERVESVRCGDLCAVVGLDEFEIGDTLADANQPEPLPRIVVDEPTMSMLFTINNSPFFGKEGKFVTSRQLRDRLYRETEKNLALRVESAGAEDKFTVYGRGVLHLSILVETMRREGYEFQVGKPTVIFRQIHGARYEPFETLIIELPSEHAGKAIELVSQRKGLMLVMEPKGDIQHLEFEIPSRGLIGLRNILLTSTAGEAVMHHRFRSYEPYAGEITARRKGSLVSMETGQALAYAIDRLQDRGRFFIDPGEQVYRGQVVGEHTRDSDLEVNVIKGKKLTNMRASGSDDNVKIAPRLEFFLEEAMEYIKEDEYLEVTPLHFRMRKIN